QHLGPAVPARVHRIVTLAPSLSELVLALGARDRLVGVTRFDEDPRAQGLPRVGGFNDPEPETVLGLHPDLVLAQTGPENRGPVEALARLGVPIEAFTLGTVEQIEGAIRGVGRLLGKGGEGDSKVAAIEERRVRACPASTGCRSRLCARRRCSIPVRAWSRRSTIWKWQYVARGRASRDTIGRGARGTRPRRSRAAARACGFGGALARRRQRLHRERA